ncbi:MAG: tetraacyldisaccharide 4'-kinase [Desulfobacterales bacterium]
MKRLKRRIERVMHADAPCARGAPVFLLTLASLLYGAAVRLRARAYRSGRLAGRRLPCQVISIGNITVGGTGKTPLAYYLAERLQQSGRRCAVVSRGYKGGAEKSGGIVSNGRRMIMPAAAAGDEPFLLATRLLAAAVPVVVGRNRYAAGMLALKHFNPEVILLDDGFQHLRLARDIDLVLLDARRPLGNGHLLPRGILREPAAALARGDIFILTRVAPGAGGSAFDPRLRRRLNRRPLYRSVHVPELVDWTEAGRCRAARDATRQPAHDTDRLAGRRVFAFAGIADNGEFANAIRRLNGDLKGFMEFADHHAYNDRDVAALLRAARRSGAEVVCTTEKDAVRLGHRRQWPIDLAVLGVRISFGDDAAAFEADIFGRLGL